MIQEMNNNSGKELLHRVHGGIGWIKFNRPEVLNALSLKMTMDLAALLTQWETDPSIDMIVIEGAGTKAFCAGGDVRAVYEAQKAGDFEACDLFFREEYTLNAHIHSYSKPYISLINGITMGGGMGVSVNGSHRIVTEHALLAMPETGIGFFPDVGATIFLTRAYQSVGLYLGLTGTPLKAKDALWFGFATHYVPSQKLPFLKADLERGMKFGSIFANHAQEPPETGFLEAHYEAIERHFNRTSLKEIFESLEADPSPFAKNTLNILLSKSPLSLAVTFRQLNHPPLTFNEGLKQEFRLSQHLVKGHDFREGVRAVLVDKDRLPHWNPSKIEDISWEDIDHFFAPLGERELVL